MNHVSTSAGGGVELSAGCSLANKYPRLQSSSVPFELKIDEPPTHPHEFLKNKRS